MKLCPTCQVEIHPNANACKLHILGKYKLGRKCEICSSRILDRNKTGFCNKHSKTGKLNPMSGKSVYSRWLEKYGKEEADRRQNEKRIKAGNSCRKRWQEPEYRKSVKENTTGKKRTAEFKKKQSENARKQFEDPNQRYLRSEAIRRSYERGTHNPNQVCSNQYGKRGYTHDGIFYASLVEKRRIETLQASGIKWKRYEVTDFDFRITYEWEGRTALYIPDFVIWDGEDIIIEELKSSLRSLSKKEILKAAAAKKLLEPLGITYRLTDKPESHVTKLPA